MDQVITEPTRGKNLLDLVILNNVRQISHTVIQENRLLSDHSTLVSFLSSPIEKSREEGEKVNFYTHDLSMIDFDSADQEDWTRYHHLLNKNLWSDRGPE